MPCFRQPGVVCTELSPVTPVIDEGTMARTGTTAPADVAALAAKPAATEPEGFSDPNYAKILESVGNGFCVPLVQFTTSVGNTGSWKAGSKMSDKPEIVAGTVIATFNAEGKYASAARGNHAAFFVEYKTQGGADGIVIYDQYREWPDKEQKAVTDLELEQAKLLAKPDKKPEEVAALGKKLQDARKALEVAGPEVDDKNRRFRRKQPGKRFIPFGKGSVSNNASSYSVVIH